MGEGNVTRYYAGLYVCKKNENMDVEWSEGMQHHVNDEKINKSVLRIKCNNALCCVFVFMCFPEMRIVSLTSKLQIHTLFPNGC